MKQSVENNLVVGIKTITIIISFLFLMDAIIFFHKGLQYVDAEHAVTFFYLTIFSMTYPILTLFLGFAISGIISEKSSG